MFAEFVSTYYHTIICKSLIFSLICLVPIGTAVTSCGRKLGPRVELFLQSSKASSASLRLY